jgi:hypothetical protein
MPELAANGGVSAGRGAVRPLELRTSPLLGRVEAAQAIEQGGLAGAVGADQARNLCLKSHVEGYAVEGDDAAEPDGHVAHAEQRRAAG